MKKFRLFFAAIIIIHLNVSSQHVSPHVTPHVTTHVTPHVTPHTTTSHSYSSSRPFVSHGTSSSKKNNSNSLYKSGNYEPVYRLHESDIRTKTRNNVVVYYALIKNKSTNKQDTVFSQTKEGLKENVEYNDNDNPVKIITFSLFMFIVVGAVFYSLKN